MSATGADDRFLLLQAYCDGELDPVNAKAVEQRIAADPNLAAERDRIMALRRALHDKLPTHSAPSGLRAKIGRTVGIRTSRTHVGWNAIAASIAAMIVVLCAAGWYGFVRGDDNLFIRELTASHARALITARATDIASSDQHAIKPWFSTRTAQAPRVVDLAAKGFALAGGRLDVIDKIPVPTLVYRHREHYISLTQMPVSAANTISLRPYSLHGFHVIGWSEGDTSYWATSDIGVADLETFVWTFRTAVSES